MIKDGKWQSYGDDELDKACLILVEATRVDFEKDGIPSEQTAMAMVKWSGTLAARLWLGWNYAPAGAEFEGQCRVTIDPDNGCMI